MYGRSRKNDKGKVNHKLRLLVPNIITTPIRAMGVVDGRWVARPKSIKIGNKMDMKLPK